MSETTRTPYRRTSRTVAAFDALLGAIIKAPRPVRLPLALLLMAMADFTPLKLILLREQLEASPQPRRA